jgi:predicted nucleic acid-binding protein
MTAEVFLDSNILLYACSSATADEDKQAIAEKLILESNFAISAQVLQEFIANALKKKILGISESQIDATVELAGHVSVLPISHELIISAIILRRKLQISHWDACIIAAASALGCHTLYSEDLNHGQDYAGVKVINPFLNLTITQ